MLETIDKLHRVGMLGSRETAMLTVMQHLGVEFLKGEKT